MAFKLINLQETTTVAIWDDGEPTYVDIYPLTVMEQIDLQGLVNTDDPSATPLKPLAKFMAPKIKSIEGIDEEITMELLLRLDSLKDFLGLAGAIITQSDVLEKKAKNSDSPSDSPGTAAGEHTSIAE